MTLADVAAPLKPEAPRVVSYAPDSWQALLIAEVEKIHRGGQLRCLTVLAGDGPVRVMVGQAVRLSVRPK